MGGQALGPCFAATCCGFPCELRQGSPPLVSETGHCMLCNAMPEAGRASMALEMCVMHCHAPPCAPASIAPQQGSTGTCTPLGSQLTIVRRAAAAKYRNKCACTSRPSPFSLPKTDPTQSQSQAKTSTSPPQKKKRKKPNRVTWAPSTARSSTPELGTLREPEPQPDLAIASLRCTSGPRIHSLEQLLSQRPTCLLRPELQSADTSRRGISLAHAFRIPRICCSSSSITTLPLILPPLQHTANDYFALTYPSKTKPWPIRVFTALSPEYRAVPLHHSPCRSQRRANQHPSYVDAASFFLNFFSQFFLVCYCLLSVCLSVCLPASPSIRVSVLPSTIPIIIGHPLVTPTRPLHFRSSQGQAKPSQAKANRPASSWDWHRAKLSLVSTSIHPHAESRPRRLELLTPPIRSRSLLLPAQLIPLGSLSIRRPHPSQ
ncbi:hypothetical protein M441DRAFT_446716 [Trichoderma asperellum CBS 433.97]|uniref:Uncharacterized protein n=1 Tax=Trichoderma asperellum (strain ATCC 204424 / CBS 433.97 / NBRC 101777) TaxID=1042311 RepID=A0A2T3YZX1_TRIA4|nr:hypothetical protein M441DRAFT_446716 [Trichoderma asperellum CBS 433.97]PTB38060.1 hypothetical protein M441DRAFT_446716 [Trichoderma asperellum CBS 433.97]